MKKHVLFSAVTAQLTTSFLVTSFSIDAVAQTNNEIIDASEQQTTEVASLSILPPELEEVLVTGGHEAIKTLAASAHLLDSEQLKKFDYSDLNNALTHVPGVYIRYEDGFGLRPNIGMRGTTSERSQKITIMEDGILITPAPYSAPAAYYLPNISRMEALETYKGPTAIRFGPHTVGGALNMATRTIPKEHNGEFDATLGSFNYQQYRLFYGDNFEQFGYWVEGMQYGSDGFKDLDTGGDTGFERNDFNGKFQFRSKENAKVQQRLTVKLGYADETSDETYLGLTDADFAADPDRRYAASQMDQFNSEHSQVHVLYSADFKNGWKIGTKGYVNRFERSWNKFDGFIDGIPTNEVLANPEIFFRELALLRGEVNSDETEAERIELTNNDREYGSQGVELSLFNTRNWGKWEHEIAVGVRFHHDYVDRDHSVRGYFMRDQALIFDGVVRDNNALNRAESDATSFFIADTFSKDKWKFDLSLRSESIDQTFDNKLDETVTEKAESSESNVSPGLGAFYQYSPKLGFLLGVHQGFSPSGASVGEDVDSEESTNIEYGFRYYDDNFNTEVIGFFNDYSNLLGRCRASDAGCTVGEEFNGGSVEVAGFEWVSHYKHQLAGDLVLPINLVYTYTETAFQSSFNSSFDQWRNVSEGDELPYVPEHAARLDIGLENSVWSAYLGFRYTGEMREVAGQGDENPGLTTNAYTTVDLAVNYDVIENLTLSLNIDNLTDEREIASRRPFGARPNLTRSYKASVKYRF